jgi:hypothetical protein
VRKQKTDKRHDVIAVWKIDRFGRSLMDLANVLADLDSLGVAFVSLRGNFDLSTVRSANVSGHWGDERIRAIAHSGSTFVPGPQRSRSGCSPSASKTKRGCRRDRSTTDVRRFVA